VPALAQPEKEAIAFAARDAHQANVAQQPGLKRI
jgi:hypothetical protein